MTKAILPRYQNNLWVISNQEEPERDIRDNKKILRIFKNKRNAKDKNIILSRFWGFIFGVDKLRINKR